MSARRDRAFGRYYARKGLRISRSELEPLPEERLSSWAVKYFRLPPDQRNPPSRIQLPETRMSATIIDMHTRVRSRPAWDGPQDRIRQVREDVKNALPGMDPMRVSLAQARAANLVSSGYRIADAVERVAKWARCATDPTDPSGPRAA